MPFLQKSLTVVAPRLPKIVRPRTHAVLDYAIVGSFVISAALFWRRNKRAALSSLVCGGANALNLMLTNGPGGKYPLLNYRTHGSIDAGLAGLTAAMPRLLDFADEPEARFFAAQAMVKTVVTGATDFSHEPRQGSGRRTSVGEDVA